MNKSFIVKPVVISVIILFFLLIAKVFHIALPVQVTSTTQATELAVVGEGKVDVVPDSANVTVGITVSNVRNVADAQSQINTTNNAIIAAMQKLGIDKKNIKTANYSVYPTYDYETGRSITGYSADVQVTITTKDTQQVSQIIEAATAAGANTISGTSFKVSDPAKYREEARNQAIKNAREQAEKIAKNLGIKLGKVTNIVEAGGSSPVMPMYDRLQGGGGYGAAEAANLQEGTQTITSVVTLYFEKR